ncbi:uncharacterized protein [Nothobranchius furzeri]|uniref:Zona pellucida sperm-binding protein 1/4 Ig-like domain-containing protein n=2 Tax=Nothobranchius furzeri TaxID=105023 RepID=A0A8C6VTF7_NOTFU|nr:uncharacterized protein LOC107396790 [Nothobranchius furzeri]
MACQESSSSGVLLRLGLLMFVTSLCHCTKMTRLKALDEKRENLARTHSKVEKSHQHYGRLLIGQNSQQAAKLNGTNSTEDVMDVEADYQADMGWWPTQQLNERNDWPKSDIAAMQHLLEMESKVECTQDSMKLLVHDAAFTPASLIFVDRGALSPLSLAKLPSSCGYTIRSTQKDLVLVAPYDGCFVVVEENSYVLPLRWWDLPVRMSCPLFEYQTPNPPMVTCHTEGMVVKTEWTSAASDIKAKVNGKWEPLLVAAQRCSFGLVEHPEGLVISVRYQPCLGKQDGLYTLELATDGETKISCPSLLAAQLEPTESLAKDSTLQSEKPNPVLFSPPDQNGFQVPRSPKNSGISSQQNWVPKEADQFPYTFFSSLMYPRLTFQEATPTKQPALPTPTQSASTQATGENFNYFPFYESHLTRISPTWSPVSKSPPAKNEDPLLSYPFSLPPRFSSKPEQPPSGPMSREPQPPNLFYYPQVPPQAYFYPLYLEKLPEDHGQLDPAVSGEPQGEDLPFHLICTQEKPASKPTGASQQQAHQPLYLGCIQLKPAPEQTASQRLFPETLRQSFLICNRQTASKSTVSQSSNSESFQDQVYLPFYLMCTQWNQPLQFSSATQPGQSEVSQSHLYQAFFPFYTQLPLGDKPAGVTGPPQPLTRQSQDYQTVFPIYTQPTSTQKPALTQPPQPMAPQSLFYQQVFPFYTQPKPDPKPAHANQPPQPASPSNNVYQPVLPFYNQPNPTGKPAEVTLAPQPTTRPSKEYQLFFPFYTKPKSDPKPAVTQPPPPATPEGQVYEPFPDIYAQLKPLSKPFSTQPTLTGSYLRGANQPFIPFYSQQGTTPADNQPSTPQGQVYQPFFNFYTLPEPTPKPTVTWPTWLPAPESQLNQQIFSSFSKPNPALKPAASQPSQPEVTQGPAYQQFYNMKKPEQPSKPSEPQQNKVTPSQTHQPLYPNQPYLEPKPAPGSTAVPRLLQSDTLPGQAHQQMCLYTQPLTESQLANMPTKTIQGKVYGPCQLSGKPGAETPIVSNPIPYGLPGVCPEFCPSGLSNCCFQIAVHQHFHITPGYGAVPQFYRGLPFSHMVHPDSTMALEAEQVPQRASTSAQMSPWGPQTAGQEYFQPPDGNPAALPTIGPSKTPDDARASPRIASDSDSSYNYWSHLQDIQLPNMEQNKFANLNGPLKPPGFRPVEQIQPDNIQFPNWQTNERLAGNVHSMQSFMPYPNQPESHSDMGDNPGIERQPWYNSELKSATHHNFKRAIDKFFSHHYMPQDAPQSNRNNSAAPNNSDTQPSLTTSKNSTYHQHLNPHSVSKSFVLLQHGPPGRKPKSFRDPSSPLGQLLHGARFKGERTEQNTDSLHEQSKGSINQEEGMSNPSQSDVDALKRLDESDLPSFFSASGNSDPVYFEPEQYFSASELKPDVLESFEDIWKSLTPTGSSRLFAARVSGKDEEGSFAVNQPSSGMSQPLEMENGD